MCSNAWLFSPPFKGRAEQGTQLKSPTFTTSADGSQEQIISRLFLGKDGSYFVK
jgi:hypothetical protein